MANKIGRIILAIVIVIAIALGVYAILPGQYKNPITQWWQTTSNEHDKTAIDTLKSSEVPGHKGITFDKMMTSATANPAFTVKSSTVDKETGTGTLNINADGYKCTVEMNDVVNDDNAKTFTEAHLQLNFVVEMTNGKVTKIQFPSLSLDETTYNEAETTDNQNVYFKAALDQLCANLTSGN